MKEQKTCIWALLSFLSPFIFLIIYILVRLILYSRIAINYIYGIHSIDLISVLGPFILGSILLPIILGIIAFRVIAKNRELKGKWLAIGGILLGVLTLLTWFVLLSMPQY